MSFHDDIRIKCLLWCDRHCCLCKKACGVDIEMHHIIPKGDDGTDELDNAIPLCFDCHAKVEHYNQRHPRGTKFRVEELKTRREQVYEEFTRHLVPPIHYEITQRLADGGRRRMPDIGFVLSHLGDSLPVRAWISVDIIRNEKHLGPPDEGYYSSQKPWRLNPRMAHIGHFSLPDPKPRDDERIEIEVSMGVEDCFGRRHPYLPVGFVYKSELKDWYFEP